MAKVVVYHQVIGSDGYQVIDNGCPMFVRIAEVAVADDLSEDDALEFAWRYTNNILDSWSAGERNENNSDYNPAVTVVEPLKDGRGHRSSMVGDVYYLDRKGFRAASYGFLPLED